MDKCNLMTIDKSCPPIENLADKMKHLHSFEDCKGFNHYKKSLNDCNTNIISKSIKKMLRNPQKCDLLAINADNIYKIRSLTNIPVPVKKQIISIDKAVYDCFSKDDPLNKSSYIFNLDSNQIPIDNSVKGFIETYCEDGCGYGVYMLIAFIIIVILCVFCCCSLVTGYYSGLFTKKTTKKK